MNGTNTEISKFNISFKILLKYPSLSAPVNYIIFQYKF